MRRFAFVAAVLAGLVLPTNAGAALFVLFDRTTAAPNERVTVRLLGTPATFSASDRRKPFLTPVRVYLVRNDVAGGVQRRNDGRLNYVASITPDRTRRGTASFTVPPLDAGTYTIATWCSACARFSSGRRLFVQRPASVAPRYRSASSLRIAWSSSCPVTVPNGNRPPRQPDNRGWYGNGRLWAGVTPAGLLSYSRNRVAADGSVSNKLLWVTTPPWRAPRVSGERIDAPAAPLVVHQYNRGSFQDGNWNPSFMTPVTFSTAGCWRLGARLDDVSLTYVVRVVVG